MLTDEEIDWVNSYHNHVRETTGRQLLLEGKYVSLAILYMCVTTWQRRRARVVAGRDCAHLPPLIAIDLLLILALLAVTTC